MKIPHRPTASAPPVLSAGQGPALVRHRRGAFELAFAASLLWSGLGAKPAVAQPATLPSLELGVLPNVSARALMQQYQVWRDYLGAELQRPVQVSTAPSWQRFHARLVAGEFDLVVTAAHMARVAQLDAGWNPVAVFDPPVRGLLVTSLEKPQRELARLKGQALGLANPMSLVAMRGLRWLADQGLQIERDFRVVRASADDSIASVVLRGDAPLAILSAGELRALPEDQRQRLLVVTTFAEVPGFVVMAHPRASPAERQRLVELCTGFAQRAPQSKAFFEMTGVQAVRTVPAGLMESLDADADATRRALAA